MENVSTEARRDLRVGEQLHEDFEFSTRAGLRRGIRADVTGDNHDFVGVDFADSK